MRTTNSERSSFARASSSSLAPLRTVDDHLHDAAAVAEVDEDELAEVALLLHPAGERDLASGVVRAKCACVGSCEWISRCCVR